MPKTGDQNYEELKDNRKEFLDKLPWAAGMERRFEKCKTVNDVIVIFDDNMERNSWDKPAWKIAFWVVGKKFGHLSVGDIGYDIKGTIEGLEKKIQGLNMENGRLKAQIEKLKEKE